MWIVRLSFLVGCVVTFVTRLDMDILACKKCGTEHEKPVENRCERLKGDKDEKKDNTKEQTVKKTPKSKAASAGPSQDKMMELMLSSMSSFSEKLAAMEERISSLAEKPQESVQESHSRKSRSREKSKTREPSEDRQDTVTYSKVFPDTAVVLKHVATPARNKKLKNDLDLGVAPLSRELIPPTPISRVGSSSLPRVTSTITRPVPATTVHHQWEQTPGNLQHKTDFKLLDKQPQCDFNQNILTHMDQYGNPVQVQAVVDPSGLVTQPEATFFEKPVEMTSSIKSMDTLRANPMIQRLVEEGVAVLESRM